MPNDLLPLYPYELQPEMVHWLFILREDKIEKRNKSCDSDRVDFLIAVYNRF